MGQQGSGTTPFPTGYAGEVVVAEALDSAGWRRDHRGSRCQGGDIDAWSPLGASRVIEVRATAVADGRLADAGSSLERHRARAKAMGGEAIVVGIALDPETGAVRGAGAVTAADYEALVAAGRGNHGSRIRYPVSVRDLYPVSVLLPGVHLPAPGVLPAWEGAREDA